MNSLATSCIETPANSERAWLTPLELCLLAAMWGASFMFQRVAAPEFGTLALVEIRLGLGALVLLPFLWIARSSFPLRLWPRLALIGAINSAIPFALFAWGAQHAAAGVGAITNSMAVLFTALVAFLFYGERIGLQRAIALIAGLAGVVVLASGKTEGDNVAGAVAAGVAAAFMYGIGANLLRRLVHGIPPVALAAATLSCSALLMLPVAVASWPEQQISPKAWFAAVMIGFVCTGAAYALYYRLIQRVGAARAVTVTYLVPLFAVAWAWMLLGEALTLPMAIAGALIIGSVALSQRAAS
jgi:drug/metabolite transporter (DMT)-like permease